jgi:3-deoxy-D-manno-octulosonate 8-phosphate phosphatase (KDO 8-P phosphatase)
MPRNTFSSDDSAATNDLQLARPIRLILSDVDGVMTGGELYYDTLGVNLKQFHVRDGMGIKVWQRAGGTFGIVSSRIHSGVRLRANELGIKHVLQGVEPKLPAVVHLLETLGVDPAETAYIGDDLPDLPVMEHVALAVAPADASSDVCAAADWVLHTRGGQGVVRELIERLMRATSTWEQHALSHCSGQ